MKVSVVSATFNRAAYLDRALATYAKQTLPFDQWEYLVVDDGSQDNTREVIAKWQACGVPVRCFDAATDLAKPKEPGVWRDGCKLRNAVTTYACGDILVSTHPEILIPPDALRLMYETLATGERLWATAIPYWLPVITEEQWPTVFDADNLHGLRNVPGFWAEDWPQPLGGPYPDYRNQNQETRPTWESEVFWGMTMGLWRWLGGFREFDVWGSVDMDFWNRRLVGGIQTVIVRDPSGPSPAQTLMVYHQEHGGSPRDMDKAMDACRGADYSTVQKMREHGGLYCVYHHGPRERAHTPGTLDGVLADHVMRYQWAASVVQGQVLDIPCGTGYGSLLLRLRAAGYLGVDIDTESIGYARQFYGGPTCTFDVGSMAKIPAEDGSMDAVVSFEGMEHIDPESQKAFVREIHRVLKSGGMFLLSTPQKGVAAGTHWDRYMLTAPELWALFAEVFPTGTLGWFSQAGYGAPHPVVPGEPGPTEHIMVLCGVKE